MQPLRKLALGQGLHQLEVGPDRKTELARANVHLGAPLVGGCVVEDAAVVDAAQAHSSSLWGRGS